MLGFLFAPLRLPVPNELAGERLLQRLRDSLGSIEAIFEAAPDHIKGAAAVGVCRGFFLEPEHSLMMHPAKRAANHLADVTVGEFHLFG